MSFLILDTDKQSTQSLRLQLGEMSERSIETGDERSLVQLKKRSGPSLPEIIFFDQDGDPLKVRAITEELKLGNVNSSVLVLGSDSKPRFSRYFDTYLRKPIFPKRLKQAVTQNFIRSQQRRNVVGYLGGAIPRDLLREFSLESALWKRVVKIDLREEDQGGVPLSKLGAVFVIPEGLSPVELEWVKTRFKDPIATRLTLVGVGKDSEKICSIRNHTDFFVDVNSDWASVVQNLILLRLGLFQSEIAVDRAKDLIERGHLFLASIPLRRILKRNPWNIKALMLLAELALKKGRLASAARSYKEILRLNPCLPKPYFRLMEIEKKLSGRPSSSTLELARNYCPSLPQLSKGESN